MTTITIPRAVVEQALEALEQDNPAGRTATITALRAALAEPTGKDSLQVEPTVAENATTQQQIEDTPPSDYRRGYWDGFNIGKREGRIEAEDALAQQVEPVEPVAWLAPRTVDSYSRPDLGYETCSKTDYGAFAVYTAPPQRKPLPLKDVERLIYENTKINPNVADDKELLGYIVNAIRAVERAHNIVE